jgi:hypothetical protein
LHVLTKLAEDWSELALEEKRILQLSLNLVSLRGYLLCHLFPVDFEEINLRISHEVQDGISECLKVVLSRLILALVSTNRGILNRSEEILAALLDVNLIAILDIVRSLCAKIRDVDLPVFDPEVGWFDVPVEEAQFVKLLNDV